jgi:perosamine synthetase
MIPVFEPVIGDDEIQAVVLALKKGEISGSFGDTIPEFENKFAQYVGCEFGIAVSSGTTALHLAVDAAGIGKGDEVLISTSTNIATALAVYHNGATVVPIDSELDTWNLDLDLLEQHITPKTKAIIPVHLFGHPVDMDRLMAIASKHNLIVIEDCAEAHGAKVRNRMVGSFGQMNCFSFYANKIITTGEGGMITTNDKVYAEKLRLLRNLAFTTPRFYHEVAGYNFRMTGMQAALGVAQLKKIETFINDKRRLAASYNTHLKNIPFLQLPAEKDWAKNVYWMYGILVKEGFNISRNALATYLKNNGVDTRTFFCPMGKQPFLKSASTKTETPRADYLWENGLYLPSSCLLEDKTIQHIAEVISTFNQAE